MTRPRGLAAAIVFLTRVPLRMRADVPRAAAAPWFPVAGALIGAAVGGSVAGLVHWLPPLVAASVGVLLGVLLTGAFHEDGLADIADAFAGGWTREDRMRILDDPLHGSYGVAALCGSIVVRIVCAGSLATSPAAAFGCIVAAHALARGGAVAMMGALPNARAEGLGAESTRGLRPRAALGGVIGAIGVAALASGWWVGPFVVAAFIGCAAVGWLAMRKVGGISGDVLGAAEQVAEVLILVTATGLAQHHNLWWAA